jgi:hypothetical protein
MGSAPRRLRRLIVVLAFALGSVAGMSGFAVLMTPSEPDPLQSMALAPADASVTPVSIARADPPAGVEATVPQATSPPAGMQPRCREDEQAGRPCLLGKPRRLRPVRALNERPAIATVAIGHAPSPDVFSISPERPVAPAGPSPASEEARPTVPLEAQPEPQPPPAKEPAAKEVQPEPQPPPTKEPAAKPARVRAKTAPRHEQGRLARSEEHWRTRSNGYVDYVAGYARPW